MSLFNNTTVQSTTSVTTPETKESTTTPVTGDFSKAMESIGVAIGEIRTGLNALPSNLEKAVTASITSDAVNQAIYDAVASASYDAISDVHADEREYTGLIKKPAVKELSPDEQKDNWIKKLLKVSSADTDQSQRRMIQDLQINFLANLAPDFYKKGVQVFDKILNDELFEKLSSELQDAGLGEGGTESSFLKTGLDMLTRLGSSALSLFGRKTKPTKTTKTPTKKTTKGKTDTGKGKNTTKGSEKTTKQSTKNTKTKAPQKTKPPKPSKTPSANNVTKAAKQTTQNVAKQAGKKAASQGAKQVATKAGAEVAKKTAGKVATKAATKVAAKTALRAIPVVGQVVGTAMLAKDLYDIGSGVYQLSNAQAESKKTVSGMFEQNDAKFAEKHKDNKRLTDANAKMTEASKRTHEISNEWGVLAFGDDVKATEAAMQFRDIMNGKETLPDDEDGQQSLDQKKVKDYVLGNVRGKYTKRLAESMIDEEIARMEYQDALKGINGPEVQTENPEITAETGANAPGAPGVPGAPPPADMPNAIPEQMAAGTTANMAPYTMNAGTGVFTSDVLTVEDQMKQFRQYMFEGTRDALLLPEVQGMFANTAQTAGSAVNKSLMGD